jgi:SAM-dependent methyltransferase
MADAFGRALRGARCRLELAGGDVIDLPVARWHAAPDGFDELLLARCAGRTLDVGCGPGRLTATLDRRGVPALGIDVSPVAVALATARGAVAVRADVFAPVPAEGGWRHVLLADGNVGIGGDPAALLRRVAELLGPGGTALVELDPPGTGLRRERARLGRAEDWFPWARLGVDAIAAPAAEAGLLVGAGGQRGGRWFVELGRP